MLQNDGNTSLAIENVGILLALVFCTYITLSAIFFTFFIRYFNGNASSAVGPTIVSVVALTMASIPVGLIPIDAFLVAYMKNATGTFKPWATDANDRYNVTLPLLCAYYASYFITLVFLFVVIPLAYFSEKTVSTGRSRQNIISALGYTGLYTMILLLLFIIGTVVPMRDLPSPNFSGDDPFRNVQEELISSRLEDTFAFALSVIRIVGIALVTTYVAVGMVVGPIGHIRGFPDPKVELAEVRIRRAGIGIEISTIQQNRLSSLQEVRQLPRSEAIRLLSLEHEDLDLREREEELKETTKHWLSPFVLVCRPTQVGAGLLGVCIGLLIFVSLLMTNILRAMYSLGEEFGYLMPTVKILNPLDRFSLFIQRVFPLDLLVLIFIVTFLVIAAASGFRKMGIGIPWIKTYHVHPWKTKNRSLLIITAKLVLILLSLDVLLLNIVPQYATFSSQHYISCASNRTLTYPPLPTPLPDIAVIDSAISFSNSSMDNQCDEPLLLPCDWNVAEGQCVMTRISVLWMRVSYKTWYFGAVYYFITWILLVVLILEGCISAFRPSHTATSVAVRPELQSF